MNDTGELLMDEYAKLLNERTRIVSVVHVSNSLGTINDVKKITAMAHAFGAICLPECTVCRPPPGCRLPDQEWR